MMINLSFWKVNGLSFAMSDVCFCHERVIFLHFFHKREQRLLISQWKNKLFISCLSRVLRICLAPMEFDDGRSTGDHAMILIGFHGLNHFRFNLPCGKTWHWTIAPISAHWVRGFPSHFGLAGGYQQKTQRFQALNGAEEWHNFSPKTIASWSPFGGSNNHTG